MTDGPPITHVSAEETLGALAMCPQSEVDQFLSSWHDLPVDPYLKNGATYRRRRYGAFRGVERMELQLHRPFLQSTQVNKLHGGEQRLFAPITSDVASSGVLKTLALHYAKRLPGDFDWENGGIGVHQIRITTSRGMEGLPAPEGVHEDGHQYVAQVFIGRSGVAGGVSWLYDRSRRPLLRATLTSPFEAILIDDKQVFHGVDPIEPAEGHETGLRDMLLIDYFESDDA
ncbi:MAG: 2OG-Fe dioxygenase family protein [Segniliparus sp.]|uniref:2OG-Fe dioxygenase family protein n=1 Tax=Segniliparus sp. TaxID=2804064 RepID=UPI003F3AEF3B